MKKYYSEFLGTFFLVLCGTGAIISNELSNGAVTHVGIALTFGLIVMAMIYSIGDISGAHINPAVSFAFFTRSKISFAEFIKYTLSQTLGALSASGILRYLFPQSANLGATIPAGSDLLAFLIEILLAFLLLFVISCLAEGEKEKGVMAGIAIGAVVLVEAMFAGPLTGASMNPARSLAPAMLSGNYQSLWVYLTAPFIGGFLGIQAARVLGKI